MRRLRFSALVPLFFIAACGTDPAGQGTGDTAVVDPTDDGGSSDAGSGGEADATDPDATDPDDTVDPDATDPDAEPTDAGGSDTTDPDVEPTDAGGTDTVPTDAGLDASPTSDLPCGIERVLEAQCASCHGEVPLFGAPMPLVSHADLTARSTTQPGTRVATLALARMRDDRAPMPPLPAPAVSDEDYAAFEAWVAAGAPAGAGCTGEEPDAGSPDAGGTDSGASDTGSTDAGSTDAGSTDAGSPDVGVVEPECEFEVEFRANSGAGAEFTVPDSSNHYECFYFAPTWTGEAHGLLFESLIDDPRVVHHWLLYAEAGAGTPGTHSGCSGSHENATLIAGWAPGGDDWLMPEGVGMDLPSDLTYFIEIHYANPRGYDTTDSSGVRVCGTNTLRENTAATHWLGSESILLFGAGSHSVTGTCTPELSEPAHILKSWPHMHRYGVGMFGEILRADGTRETLIDTPFSFDNQISHDTPATIYPGDRIRTTCDFETDTTLVTFGPNTEQEMCYNFVVAWPAGAFDTGGGIRGGSDNFCLR